MAIVFALVYKKEISNLTKKAFRYLGKRFNLFSLTDLRI